VSRSSTSTPDAPHRVRSDLPFYLIMGIIGGTYVVLILALLGADAVYMVLGEPPQVADPAWSLQHPLLAPWVNNPIVAALGKPEIRYSIQLSLISCTTTAILSLLIAVPIGYLLARYQFPGCNLIDAVLDIPIVLPPLVVGLSLLILFQYAPTWLRDAVVYQVPAVILAQLMVACAFAVRTMRATFDQIDPRREQVALTLGCSRAQAFPWDIVPGGLSLTLSGGGRHTQYWLRDALPRRRFTRTSAEFSAELSAVLERFDRSGRLRHTIEPTLRYNLVNVKDQTGFPNFDSGFGGLTMTTLLANN